MITSLFDKNIVKVLSYFSISPGSRFSRKDLKEATLLNNVPLDAALKTLLSAGTLSYADRLYSLNFENQYAKTVIDILKKEYIRFKELPFKVYLALIDIDSMLSGFNINTHLFGSFAKLIYTERSDIDLAVVLNEPDKKLVENIKRVLEKVEKKYKKNIECHFFTEKDMQSSDPLIKEILKNGVRL